MLAVTRQTLLHEQLLDLGQAFGLEPGEVISLVGAGGKTTLMYALARVMGEEGLAITTTTTKIMPPGKDESEALFLGQEDALLEEAARSRGRRRVITLAHRRLDSGKLEGVSPGLVDRLAVLEGFSGILVEADGSARRPLKAPNATEPVIAESTTLVIAVVGMKALGCPLDEAHVFRAARAAELLGLPLGARVGAEEIARLITHPQGIAKGTPAGARIVPFLNRVDIGGDLGEAPAVARAVLAAGHPQMRRVVMGEAGGEKLLVLEREPQAETERVGRGKV